MRVLLVGLAYQILRSVAFLPAITRRGAPTPRSVRSCRQSTGSAEATQDSIVSISDAFDGGNIELLHVEQQGEKVIVSLRIKPDPYTELERTKHMQHFAFRSTVRGPWNQPFPLDRSSAEPTVPTETRPTLLVEYVIENAGDASYAQAWDESTVCYSTSLNDADRWRRNLGTLYRDNKLIWQHRHDASSGSVFFSYVPPYSYQRHLDLVTKCYTAAGTTNQFHLHCRVESLGQSIDGREIECITVGTGARVGWIIHRQHPGEHMAEYFAEGLLDRLLGTTEQGNNHPDDIVRTIGSLYTLHIVPNMNPDGAVRGHLRTNSHGANLNREWADSHNYTAPSLQRSPEVYHVLQRIKDTGCDVFLDVHGDEVLPYNFLAQPTVPNWGKRLESLHGAFAAAYQRANADMQRKYGYEAFNQPCHPSKVLRVASSQVAARFDCLAVTLEMPFKDCRSNPDPERGWSPQRAQKLGASLLEPLLYIHPFLRDETEFWNSLPEDDAYILPTSKYRDQ